MKYKLLTIIFCLIIGGKTFAQTTNGIEMWYKLSPEITFSVKDRFDFKIKPGDCTITPASTKIRFDFLAGVKIWKFTLYSFSKFDHLHGSWTGIRFDFTTLHFDNKLMFHLQERYFWGLNDKSKDHYYLLQRISWNLNKTFNAGILGYGKFNTNTKFNEGIWLFGPIVGIKFLKNFEIQLTINKDIFRNDLYMTMFILKYKLKFE